MSLTQRNAVGPVECWCPQEAEDPSFGQRSLAERLIEVPYLRDEKKLKGNDVNVVIVDQGLNKERLGASYAGGWPARGVQPGKTALDPTKAHGGHGMMIAENIRKVAPEVRIFDLPMIPPRILDIPEFFNENANAAFETMLNAIAKRSGHFILVNAWAIYDRTSEQKLSEKKKYTNNPDHPFNRLMDTAVTAGHDVVFGAGNCGEFCPDPRCGAGDHGRGNSILGANSHPKVLTVGAVRCDRMWLGFSSQGPGKLYEQKPDLCAPSEFIEDRDANTRNDGTSAATALAAGVLACLRGRWPGSVVSPEDMRDILNQTTTRVGETWSRETGNGILNAKQAHAALEKRYGKTVPLKATG